MTALFWLIKIASTGMGETTSDFLVLRFEPVLVVGIAAVILTGSIVLQLTRRRFVPWVYWLAVVMVSVFGTMAADVIHVALGVPYIVSTVFLAILLGAIFVVWHAAEGALSMGAIDGGKRELFYWTAVVVTFALGTAAGDLAASTLRLGYLVAGIVFLCLFAIPVIGWRFLGLNSTIAFWIAYILTRPLGASFADWAGVTRDRGGLDWGTGPVSLVLALLIAGLVVVASRHRRA